VSGSRHPGFLHYVVPAIPIPGLVGNAIGPIAKAMAPIIAVALAVAAPIAYFRQRQRRRLLDAQTGLESIRALSWQDVERLVGEGFRRLGYAVEEQGGATPDAGIDLVLRKDGAKTIVQCKHWRSKQVGVKPIRELYGVMVAEKADGASFVASGDYTREAKAFTEGKPIGLIDGKVLLELVERVRAPAPSAPGAASQRRDPTLRL